MQNPTENSIPSNPSNPIEISDNEDINYQINTTSTKNQNRKNVELPYQKSSTSSIGNNDFKVQIDKLTEEKKALMESLKNEMIYNEEQRNYIQILKETIESNLYKSGLANLIQSSKQYQSYDNDSLADFFIDFNRNKSESEKYRKELNLANNVINDNKQEIKSIRKDLEDLSAENILLKQKIEKEKETKKEMINERERYDTTINNLTTSINSLRTQNQILRDQIQEYQSMTKTHEQQIQSTYNQIDNMSNDLTKYRTLENTYNRLLSEHEQLKYDILTIQKEKASLETELSQQKNDSVRMTSVIRNLQVENQNCSKSLHDLQSKFDELKAEKNSLEKINETLRFRMKELDESNNKISELIQQNNELNVIKDNNEKIVTEYINKISILKVENEKLNYEYNKVKNELKSQSNEYVQLENENKELTIKIREISQEHNEVLLAHHESEMEVNRNIAEKAAIDNERRYWKGKYDEDMFKKEGEIQTLVKQIKELKEKNDKFGFDIGKLQKINKDLSEQYQDKCQNETLLINEREKYKASVMKMNQTIEKSIDEVQSEKSNMQLLMNRNTELEKKVTELLEQQKIEKETKIKLIEEINNLQNNQKNISSGLSSSVLGIVTRSSLNNPNNYSKDFTTFINKHSVSLVDKTCPEKDIQEFIHLASLEIEKLNEELNKAREEISTIHMKYHDVEKEKQNHKKLKDDISKKYNDVSIEITRLSQDNNDLLIEIDNYKSIVSQLKATCDNYSQELNSKNTMLNNVTYELNCMEDKNIKITNDKNYLETILLRVCKMFPNSNLYRKVHDILDSFVSIEEKDKLNQELLVELKRAEDYLRITKENSLEANYLNKQLTRQLEEVNMQLRTARSVPSMNNSGIEINMSYGKTWSNTNNNQEI